MNRRARPFRCRAGGFTLMEMMITMAIFILLVAAVFALMTGVLESTASLQDTQNRREETTALYAFLKQKLTTLPAHYTVVSYQRGDGEGLTQNGVLYGNATQASVVDAKVQDNGYYTIRFATYAVDTAESTSTDARQVMQQLVTTDDPSLTWRKLVTDIKTLDWKFQDFNDPNWSEIWTSSTEPNLIEFTMQPAAETQLVTMDFWLPAIQAPSMGAARQAARASSSQ